MASVCTIRILIGSTRNRVWLRLCDDLLQYCVTIFLTIRRHDDDGRSTHGGNNTTIMTYYYYYYYHRNPKWRDIRGIYLAPQGRRHCAPQLRAGKSIIFSVLPGAGAINGPAAALSHGGGDVDGGGDRHTTADGHTTNIIWWYRRNNIMRKSVAPPKKTRKTIRTSALRSRRMWVYIGTYDIVI